MHKILLAISCSGLLVAGCASTIRERFAYEEASNQDFGSDTLTTFGSAQEFRDYLRRVHRAAERAGIDWRGEFESGPKQKDETPVASCDPDDLDEACEEVVVVTGSRVANSTALSAVQITNTQEVGVDEGDVVKQIGDYLVTLQDGRLFSVTLRPGGQDGLALVDRIDIYSDPERDIWYDEILVTDGRVLVTAYSYEDEATEFTVIGIDEDGRFERQARFLIASDDYYSTDNYATRIIDNRLILHTPLDLIDIENLDEIPLPQLRRVPLDSREPFSTDMSQRTDLVGFGEIYRPLLPTLAPAIHTVTLCEIDGRNAHDPASCDAVSMMAPMEQIFYVSGEHVYLWTQRSWDESDAYLLDEFDTCSLRTPIAESEDTVLYRLSTSTRQLSAVFMRGSPMDQFGLMEDEDHLHAIVISWDPHCEIAMWDAEASLYLANLPDRWFRTTDISRPEDIYSPLPAILNQGRLLNRFSATHAYVVGRNSFGLWPPAPSEPAKPARLIAVDIHAPDNAQTIQLTHDVIRMERLGERMFVSGYRDESGLDITLVEATDKLDITAHLHLPARYETEGRSHAFNASLNPDGDLIMGLPTRARRGDVSRWWWRRSEESDISFLSLDVDNTLSHLGELSAGETEAHESYRCDVSCIDWYGNSRPIFTYGRIFALSGTMLIEGQIRDGQIAATRQVDLTAPIP